MAEKIKVEIFIPTGACACTYARWMDKIWAVLVKNRDMIDFQVKPASSPEAEKYGILQMGIVVNEHIKFGTYVRAEQLERAIQSEAGKLKSS